MQTKMIALREDLKARREKLDERAELIEEEILKLTEQINDLNTLILNLSGARPKTPSVGSKKNTMTIRDVLDLFKDDVNGFTAREVVQRAHLLPNPITLNIDSVRSTISKLRASKVLDILLYQGSEAVYSFRG